MQRKDEIALLLLFGSACGGVFLTTLSYRIRDLFFFLMVTLSAVTEYIDVNFASREWYRGTTCGFEVSMVDVISLSVLLSSRRLAALGVPFLCKCWRRRQNGEQRRG